MKRRTLIEQLRVERAAAAELKHLLDTDGRDASDLTEEELAEYARRASDRAEAGFSEWVDRGIDDAKERRAARRRGEDV
jgi:hypothetical protein